MGFLAGGHLSPAESEKLNFIVIEKTFCLKTEPVALVVGLVGCVLFCKSTLNPLSFVSPASFLVGRILFLVGRVL